MGARRARMTRNEHASAVRALFDSKADAWAVKYSPRGALAWRIDAFLSAVVEHVPPPGRLLDLGCGTGQLACAFLRRGYDVTGCDVSPAMIDHARLESTDVRWCLLESSGSSLPFADEEFDAIVASSVLEYVGDVELALAELARVLRSGGALVFTVPNVRHLTRYLERIVGGLVGRMEYTPWVPRISPRLGAYVDYLRLSKNRYGREDWCRKLEQLGFERSVCRTRAPGTMVLLGFRRRTRA
jgi:ubiquinone/menaquinone biosynthesis C-methylase UbiE